MTVRATAREIASTLERSILAVPGAPARRPRHGFGSLVPAAALTAGVVYSAARRTSKVPLSATTAGTQGALALIAVVFGIVVVMSVRSVVSAGRLELGSTNAVRAGAATARTPIGTAATSVEILMPTLLVVYDGTVVVLVNRWLRSWPARPQLVEHRQQIRVAGALGGKRCYTATKRCLPIHDRYP